MTYARIIALLLSFGWALMPAAATAQAYPSKPIISTEEGSQVMTRGAYATDRSKNVLNAYDEIIRGWTDPTPLERVRFAKLLNQSEDALFSADVRFELRSAR